MFDFNGNKVKKYQGKLHDNSRWILFTPRAGDIIISTIPKAGTTWTQMICALLIFRSVEFGKPLTDISPWLDQTSRPMEYISTQYEAQQHRRFIKTHTPLDGLPYYEPVSYIFVGRHPLDMVISEYNHHQNFNQDVFEKVVGVPMENPFENGIDDFVQRGIDNAPVWHHLKTFWQARDLSNVQLLHYSDLKSNLANEMGQLAKFLQIEIDRKECKSLSAYATFDYMKQNAEKLAPGSTQNFFKSNKNFFHAGREGLGKKLLSKQSIEAYEQAKTKYPAEMVQWIEFGQSSL